MPILTLPPETLWDVLKRLPSVDLYRIAMTCPKLLWTLLNTSCIAEVQLQLNPADLRLPLLICKFPQIRSFAIYGSEAPLELNQKYLLTLPESITNLILDYKGAYRLLLPNFSHLDETTHSTFALQAARRVFTHFSNLSKLALQVDTAIVSSLIASVLPSALTHLEIRCPYNMFVDAQLAFPTNLPAGLQTLILPNSGNFDGPSLAQLEHLETLHIPSVSSVPWLPSSVTDLALLNLPDWLAERNPQVRKLMLGDLPSASATYPPQLLELHISSYSVDAATINSLPRSLQKLSMSGMANFSLPSNVSYPPLLTSFGGGVVLIGDEDAFKALPRGLTVLYVYMMAGFPSRLLPILPRGFTVFENNFNVDQHMDFQQYLPDITSLSLTMSSLSSSVTLPLRLVSLTAIEAPHYHHSLVDQLLGIMPATLTRLTLKSKMPVFGPFPFSSLPGGLLLLDLEIRSTLPLDHTHVDLTALPKRLESLKLKANFSVDFDASGLRKLPVDLKHLTLKGLPTVSDEDIPFLPRCLESLKISNSRLFTDACLAHLPPLLQSLSFPSNRNITPALFEHRSRHLVKVEMRTNKNFPKSLHDTIPRGLRIMTRKLKNM